MITAKTLHGFTMAYLIQGYDNPKPIPRLHWEMWKEVCSDEPWVAIASPREHSKSTCITHAYGLLMSLSGEATYTLLISDTEEQACEFLGDMSKELRENDSLRRDFGVKKLLKDTEANLICLMSDGRQFRILAKGSEQKVRGRKWRGQRPDLILCHEKGTRVFADGEWMINDDHPTAKHWETPGFEVKIGDESERVSEDHRYWVKQTKDSAPEWVEARHLKAGMYIGE